MDAEPQGGGWLPNIAKVNAALPEDLHPVEVQAWYTQPHADLFIGDDLDARVTSLPIEPRKRWPTGGLPKYGVRGVISAEHRAEAGKALCIWGDAGWGGLVRRGKYQDGRFADDLVRACADLMAQWAPRSAPEWVTCIPSRRHPHLVPDFAERLAAELGLPFHRSLSKVEDRAEQKSMANSVQQARNVDGSLAVCLEPLPGESVLLVDDMVDSRWTLTVAAWLLRCNGSGEVWPLALALASQDR